MLDSGEDCAQGNLAAIVERSRFCVFGLEVFADVFVVYSESPTLRYVWTQRLEPLLFVLQVFRGSNKFLHGRYIKKLVDVVVVSQEIRWEFPRAFELAVFSDDGLDFFDKRVFGVIAADVGNSVGRILKFLRIGELDGTEKIVTA